MTQVYRALVALGLGLRRIRWRPLPGGILPRETAPPRASLRSDLAILLTVASVLLIVRSVMAIAPPTRIILAAAAWLLVRTWTLCPQRTTTGTDRLLRRP
jgi:hypothetical protein